MYVCDLWSVMAGNGQSGCLHGARAGGGSDRDKEKMTCHRLSARLLLLKKSLWMLTGAVTVIVTTTFSSRYPSSVQEARYQPRDTIKIALGKRYTRTPD
jgi:hypothetical protein